MSQETIILKKLLKTNGYFLTTPRLRLFALLQKHDTLTIPELIKYLSQQDQATIYRTIKLYETLGIINRLRFGPSSKIELSDIFEHHHHHFSCTKCGVVIVLPEVRIIEETITKLGQKQNFYPTDHQLEIRGLCYTCNKIIDNQ